MGAWLVSSLLERGAKVVALVRDFVPQSRFYQEDIHSRVVIVKGDLANREFLQRVIAEYEIKTVFHLAAQTIVGIAKKDPVGTLEANVRGSWNLLEAVRLCEQNIQVVFASSDKAYGNSNNLPYLESHPLAGEFPYDASKSCADLIAHMYSRTYDVSVAITRCGNIFGGGDLNFNRTIPGVILSTLQGKPFQIRSDGKFVRDFLYVEDAVDGYMRLAQRLDEEPSLSGEGFNFSLGLQLTVLEIVNQVLQLMGRSDLSPEILNIATAEIREQYMLADKAARILHWEPKYKLEAGLKKTIAWYENFFDNNPHYVGDNRF